MVQRPPASPARVEIEKFVAKHPLSNRFRVSTKNENGRWISAGDVEDFDAFCQPSVVYRFQAYDGRTVAGYQLWESPGQARAQALEDDLPTREELDLLTAPLDVAEPAPAQLPMRLVEAPAPASVDPWLDLFRQRMSEDNRRIQELHSTVLSLVGSVSQHHQGATAPLIKLIDQLGRSLTRFHVSASQRIADRQSSLAEREDFIEVAESTAEEKLSLAEEAAAEAKSENAILQGLMQHLGPQILEKILP